jgi:uncharacterized protein (DUF2235 family)
MKMKSNRVILCNGTWGTRDAEYPTNIRKLVDMIADKDAQGNRQLVYYNDGVGTKKGGLASAAFNIMSGAFGWGLDGKILESYRDLSLGRNAGEEFDVDDVLWFSGFSRGSYTIRSLGGLIRKVGIGMGYTKDQMEEGLALYRKRDSTPDTEEAMRFRTKFSPRIYVSDLELEWRKANIKSFLPENAKRLSIKFLGPMETVGALGVPEIGVFKLLGFLNDKYKFHNTNASRIYENILHIVAINERRKAFTPTLISNCNDLNREAGFDPASPDAPYQEVWSPGDHGSVGGGGDIVGLSSYALLMQAMRMQKLGLNFKPGAIESLAQAVNALAPLTNHSTSSISTVAEKAFLAHADRNGPSEIQNVSIVTHERWKKDPSYRHEPTLQHVANELNKKYG